MHLGVSQMLLHLGESNVVAFSQFAFYQMLSIQLNVKFRV